MNISRTLLKRSLQTSACLLTGLSLSLSLQAETLSPDTALPVVFTHAIDAKTVTAGAKITAKTMQPVVLPGGAELPKGTMLLGEVVAANRFSFDETPYAKQQPSRLEIKFDELRDKNGATPISVSVRAVASSMESQEAEAPHYLGDIDHVGTMELIGGGQYSPLEKNVTIDDEPDVVGYNRKHGVYARLLSASYAGKQDGFRCEPTQTEQAVGIFSPQACGLYGFEGVSLTKSAAQGTFTLSSTRSTVKLYAGSTALLQVQSSQ